MDKVEITASLKNWGLTKQTLHWNWITIGLLKEQLVGIEGVRNYYANPKRKNKCYVVISILYAFDLHDNPVVNAKLIVRPQVCSLAWIKVVR